MAESDVIAGRFAIEGRAGAGSTGVVMRARDLDRDAPVAVKLISAGHDGARFEREVALLAGLSHPGIVGYVAHGLHPGTGGYLVMEWVDGPTLDDVLEARGVTAAEAVELAGRVADALAAAHARGVVHRDVKPANLLLPGGAPSAAKLADFGIARQVEHTYGLTETGTMVGTPGYMAPEQARGGAAVGTPADVFALGCLLYECLSGRAAFAGRSVMALRAKLILSDPEPLPPRCPEAPPVLAALVTRMLDKGPQGRPTAAEVAAAIAAVSVPGGPRRRRHRVDAATVALAADRGPIVVLGIDAVEPAGETLETLARARASVVDGVARRHGGAGAVMPDAALVVTLADGAPFGVRAARAARCAHELAAALPGLMLSIACGAGAGDPVDGAADRLTAEVVSHIFAGASDDTGSDRAGAVFVDAGVAAALPAHLVRRAGADRWRLASLAPAEAAP